MATPLSPIESNFATEREMPKTSFQEVLDGQVANRIRFNAGGGFRATDSCEANEEDRLHEVAPVNRFSIVHDPAEIGGHRGGSRERIHGWFR